MIGTISVYLNIGAQECSIILKGREQIEHEIMKWKSIRGRARTNWGMSYGSKILLTSFGI